MLNYPPILINPFNMSNEFAVVDADFDPKFTRGIYKLASVDISAVMEGLCPKGDECVISLGQPCLFHKDNPNSKYLVFVNTNTPFCACAFKYESL